MGGTTSKVDEGELAKKYNVTTEEVHALIDAFTKNNKKGKAVSLAKFKKVIAEVAKVHDNEAFHPEVVELCFQLFDSDHNGKVGTDEFISGIAILTAGTVKQKAELVFKCIDKNADGFITKPELRQYITKTVEVARAAYTKEVKDEGVTLVLRMGLNVALKVMKEEVIDDILNQAFKADTNNDAKLDLGEWVSAAEADNSAIVLFLNPGVLVTDLHDKLKDHADESGLVTSKGDQRDLFKELTARK